jgi:hypothetical protein
MAVGTPLTLNVTGLDEPVLVTVTLTVAGVPSWSTARLLAESVKPSDGGGEDPPPQEKSTKLAATTAARARYVRTPLSATWTMGRRLIAGNAAGKRHKVRHVKTGAPLFLLLKRKTIQKFYAPERQLNGIGFKGSAFYTERSACSNHKQP